MFPGYAHGPALIDALARMDVPTNKRTAFVPNIQRSVIASFDHAGTLTKAAYEGYGSNTEGNRNSHPRCQTRIQNHLSLERNMPRLLFSRMEL